MEASRGGQPLLPPHPALIERNCAGPRTVFISASCPRAMARPGPWSVADYVLRKELYRGKASTLYQAICRTSGQTVVLKSYSKRRLSNLNWYQVDREIRLHSGLQHENIIALYAAFEDADHVFLVQEIAEGGDLYEDLKRAGGQYSERQVARDVLPPFLSALHYLHSRNIIHRDIKPENILLAGNRALKMADFGLSIDCSEERPVTRAGTLDYMSPEVLRCPEKSAPEENKEKVLLGYTAGVDVWACGVLAYELLVGRPPFEKESREETYRLIMNEEPAFPLWVPEGARDFICSALAKSARKRPTVLDLLRHPWLQLHSSRRSMPSHKAGMDLPLEEVATPGFELHRQSMHGATTSRTQHREEGGKLGPPCAAAAAAAAAAAGSSRPGTPLRVAPKPPGASAAATAVEAVDGVVVVREADAADKPSHTPSAAAGTPAKLPPPVGVDGGQQPAAPATSNSPRTVEHVSLPPATASKAGPRPPSPHHSLATTALLEEGRERVLPATQPAVAPAPAPAAGFAGSFMELYKSLAAADKEAAAPDSHSNNIARSTSAGRPGSGSAKAGDTTLPPLQQASAAEGQQARPGTAGPRRTSSMRRVISQPTLHTEPLPTLAPAPSGGVHAEASRSSSVSSSSVCSPRTQGLAAAGPPVTAAVLPAILERTSTAASEASAAVPASAVAEQAVAAEAPTVAEAAHLGNAATAPASPKQQQQQPPTGSPSTAASLAEAPRASSPMGGAERSHDAHELGAAERARQAERKHIQKLQARAGAAIHVHATAVVVEVDKAARLWGAQKHEGSGAQHARAGAGAGAAPRQQAEEEEEQHQQQQKQQGGRTVGASIARTAESLLAKLLGKREVAHPHAGAHSTRARPQTAAASRSAAAPASGLVRAKSDAATLGRPRGTAAVAAAASSRAAPKVSPVAGARHAGASAMASSVYTVTDRGVVRAHTASPGRAKVQSSGGSLTRGRLQGSGGSVTLKTPAAGAPAGASTQQRQQAEQREGSDATAQAAAALVAQLASPRGSISKHVQFSERSADAGPKLGKQAPGEAGGEDGDREGLELIRAHRADGSTASSWADSFTTATSGPPSMTLPGLRSKSGGSLSAAHSGAGGGSAPGSPAGSPAGSRKGSLVSPPRVALLAAKAATPSHSGGRAAPRRLGGQAASSPGGPRGGAAAGADSGPDCAEEEETEVCSVQRSAASWAPGSTAARARAKAGAAAGPRLNMYLAMGRRGGCAAHEAFALGRLSCSEYR